MHEIVVTFVGFVLFLGSPVAYHKLKFDGLFCLLAFVWGVHLLTH
jgi:hypothetical protein